jgi:hypothetical protein
MPNGAPSFMGLFCFLTLDRLPLEKAIDRHDAAALAVGTRNVGRSRTVSHFALMGFAATPRVIAPIRDQAPTERVERDISGLVVSADD